MRSNDDQVPFRTHGLPADARPELQLEAADLFEVGFCVALADVQGEVGHPLGVGAVVSERIGACCPSRSVEDLRRSSRDLGPKHMCQVFDQQGITTP